MLQDVSTVLLAWNSDLAENRLIYGDFPHRIYQFRAVNLFKLGVLLLKKCLLLILIIERYCVSIRCTTKFKKLSGKKLYDCNCLIEKKNSFSIP